MCHAAERPFREAARTTVSEQETLTSAAEFAIALAGFSGIVVALGKQPGRWAPADRYRLLNVLTFAFGAGFMAYLPMGLAHAGLGGSPLWRASPKRGPERGALKTCLSRLPTRSFSANP